MAMRDGGTLASLPIGAVARAAAVNVETIRYYQRRGLLDEPEKPLGGHRRYADSAVGRVSFIKRAQQLGFTLDEARTLDQRMVRLSNGTVCCADVIEQTAWKIVGQAGERLVVP